ncbi:hypothetical protein KI387_013864, partial [Taxus chinensis]
RTWVFPLNLGLLILHEQHFNLQLGSARQKPQTIFMDNNKLGEGGVWYSIQ